MGLAGSGVRLPLEGRVQGHSARGLEPRSRCCQGWIKRGTHRVQPLLRPICASLPCPCASSRIPPVLLILLVLPSGLPAGHPFAQPTINHTFLPTLLLLTLHYLWMLPSCPTWGWHCSCLKERPGRGRKASTAALFGDFASISVSLRNHAPRGNPGQILLAQPSERGGSCGEKEIPQNPTL